MARRPHASESNETATTGERDTLPIRDAEGYAALFTNDAVIDESEAEPAVESVMLMVGAGPSPTALGSARVRQTVGQAPDGWRISTRTIDTRG